MEVAKVSSEAQEAQKGDQEQLYREAAIKKQIDYLQKELDEMHPENISDVRAFEKKIQESGMNEDARKEADKIKIVIEKPIFMAVFSFLLHTIQDFVRFLTGRRDS